MSEPPDKFKKQPRRKADRGRSIAVSPEARQAYEDAIKQQTERDAYERHLPSRERK